MTTDFITILQSKGPRLAKRWTADGILQYDRAKNFTSWRQSVLNLRDLSARLQALEAEPTHCVIRGSHVSFDPQAETTRDLENFTEVPHHWICLDVDDWPAAVYGGVAKDPERAVREFITEALPVEFHHASCHWQLSNSAGAPGKEHILKAHLWFWLSEPRGQAELEFWARALKLPVDITVFRTVQVHYTAAPVIDEGVHCPVIQRSGWIDGMLGDEVDLVMPAEMPERERRAARHEMRDPRDIPGIVGAFCRVYDPRRAIAEFLPHVFEYEGDSDVRLTWLQGGGAAGGACITDDELRVYNSHSTDPLEGNAANAFDLCRVHLHGHLDDHVPPGTPPADLPSHAAMSRQARELPEVAAELTSTRTSPNDDFGDIDEAEDFEELPPPATPVAIDEREQVVLRAAASLDAATTATQLEQEHAARLKDLDWSDGERERLARAIQARFRAITGTSLPIATARQWLTPAPTASGFPDVNADGRVLGTIGNVEALLQQNGIVVRYNVISKEDEILIPGAAFTLDNKANAAFSTILSLCGAVDMKIQSSTLKGFLTTIADRHQYNPALAWIESQAWDGTDRLQAWFDTVQGPADKRQLKEALMRRWAIQCVAILHNTGDMMARGVLTFQGVQYQGKGRWLQSLAPPGLVRLGVQVDTHNKDHIKIAISAWLAELGELDTTFRRSDLGALKNFVSSPVDTFRRPYAAAEGSYPRRTSFYASVNDGEFLRDPTGNSRYWVIPVDTINYEHGIDAQQLWAQVLQLWRAGEQHWLTEDEMARINESNVDFTIRHPLEERLLTELPWGEEGAEFVWATTGNAAGLVGCTKLVQTEAQLVGQVLRRASERHYPGERHVKLIRGVKHYRVPVRRDE